MNEARVTSVAIGIAVGGLLAAALLKRSMFAVRHRLVVVASFALGFLVHRWLYSHPESLEVLARQITLQAVGVIAAAIGGAILFWKTRAR